MVVRGPHQYRSASSPSCLDNLGSLSLTHILASLSNELRNCYSTIASLTTSTVFSSAFFCLFPLGKLNLQTHCQEYHCLPLPLICLQIFLSLPLKDAERVLLLFSIAMVSFSLLCSSLTRTIVITKASAISKACNQIGFAVTLSNSRLSSARGYKIVFPQVYPIFTIPPLQILLLQHQLLA